MEKTPYHHLPDGSFRNPEGSPERNSNFKWSFKIFNKEKKKLDMAIPEDHAIEKQKVLSDLENLKNSTGLKNHILDELTELVERV